MNLTTIDQICRRGLLESGLPIHFYAEYLFHASTCLRELNFDTLQIVNTANLPVGDYGEVGLPDDFVDDIAVCAPNGAGIFALPKQDWLNPIRIHDIDTGEFVTYPPTDAGDNGLSTFYGLPMGWSYYWNVDSYGMFTGRRFGAHGGTVQGYKVVKERRQIQMTEAFIGGNVIVQYISDGQSIDAASQIDYLAFQCIRAFQEWKRSENRNADNSPEGRAFYNQKRVLRTRLNPLTISDIRNIIRTSYSGGIKF